jgi:chaperonin GroES
LSDQLSGVSDQLQSTGLVEQPRPRLFFVNLEQALEIDKIKSMRREARAFMPIRDQVLVFECAKEEFSDAGTVIIPATAQEKQSEGVVVAVGRGRVDANNIFAPTEVEPGDRVLFGKYAGTEIKLRGKTCRLMREDELLGVIR